MVELRRVVGPKVNPETARLVQGAIRSVQRGEFKPALAALRAHYARPTEKLPPEGLSYYGLCLAKVEGRYRDAIELCKQSLERNEQHGSGYVNLSRVYLLSGNRRKAVEALEHGLALFPENPMLLSWREEMGYRRKPVLPFLHRDNFLNVLLGKRLRRRQA